VSSDAEGPSRHGCIIYSLYVLSLVISEAEFFCTGYETYMMAAMSVLLKASIEKFQD